MSPDADAAAGDYMDAFWIVKCALDAVDLELGQWSVGGIGLGDVTVKR